MLTIRQTYTIKASPERVWDALTKPSLQKKWSGQGAKYTARLGGKYTLFDNYVTGKVIEWDPPKKLVQTWKPVDWTITDSTVSFTLTKTKTGTRVKIVHKNVQPEDY